MKSGSLEDDLYMMDSGTFSLPKALYPFQRILAACRIEVNFMIKLLLNILEQTVLTVTSCFLIPLCPQTAGNPLVD